MIHVAMHALDVHVHGLPYIKFQVVMSWLCRANDAELAKVAITDAAVTVCKESGRL